MVWQAEDVLWFLFGLVVVIVVGVAVVLVVRSRNQARARAEAADATSTQEMTDTGEFSASAIKVGDVVTLSGTDHLVVGSVRYEEQGFVWHEHMLEDEDRTWLSVEDDEGRQETVLWSAVKGSGLEPTGQQLVHRDLAFSFDERGEATYRATGSTGLPAAGTMQYADYRGPGGQRLGFERFKSTGGWEVAAGVVVERLDLRVWARPVEG